MIRDTLRLMNWMLSLRIYDLKIHYNISVESRVTWIDHHILEFEDKQFNMTQFRSMIHDLVSETKRLLIENLLLISEIKKLLVMSLQKLRDNLINQDSRWNFLQNQRASWSIKIHDSKWLWERVDVDSRLRRRFVHIKKEDSRLWNRSDVEFYLIHLLSFRAKLLILMHLTKNQLARESKILSVRHRNTMNDEHRNVFVKDDLLMFVIRYHKSYNIINFVKIIHRYLS